MFASHICEANFFLLSGGGEGGLNICDPQLDLFVNSLVPLLSPFSLSLSLRPSVSSERRSGLDLADAKIKIKNAIKTKAQQIQMRPDEAAPINEGKAS